MVKELFIMQVEILHTKANGKMKNLMEKVLFTMKIQKKMTFLTIMILRMLVKCGLNMRVIFRTVKNMDLEHFILQMVINSLDISKKIKLMEKVNIQRKVLKKIYQEKKFKVNGKIMFWMKSFDFTK